MRIRNRKVPLPLSSLSPIPLSDPQFSQSPVVQLQLHSIPHQKLLQEPQKDEYFDLQLPSDQLNHPIGGGSEGHDDCFCGAGPQEENKVLLQEGDETRGGAGAGEKSNDARKVSFLSEGVHVTVLQQSSSSHQGAGRWGEGDRAFPLKKRRGSVERRSNEETIMDRNKKMKTKMKTKMNKKCVQQNGDNEADDKETKEDAASKVKTKARGGALLEGSRCSRVNGRGWRCFQQTLVGYSLCEHHLGKGRLRSMNSVRSRSIATTVPKKDEHGALSSPSLLSSPEKEETKQAASLDDKVSGAAYNEDDKVDKEKPLMISRRKLKLGMVKARSISSLLGQANYAIGVAEDNDLNSFSSVNRAIDYEISRQVLLHSQGQGSSIVQETRLWEEGSQKTITMRKKEGLSDYRYFPEPDLPEVIVKKEYVDSIQNSLPELPEMKRRRYESMGLSMQDVLFLANDINVAEFFDATIAKGADVKLATNWIMGDIAAYMKNEKVSINDIKLKPQELAELIASIKDGTISGKIGKEILFELIAKGGTVKGLIEEKNLVQIVDPAEIEKMVDKVLSENPKQLEQFRAGKTKIQGFFAGQVMKISKGKANPGLLNKILQQKLNATS